MSNITLVLDQAYQPVARVTWQRALTLLFQGKVEVVEEYEDREVRSVTFTMKIPAIVRFIARLRNRRKAVKFSRENIYLRDKGKCQFCGIGVSRAAFTYDHLLPRARGGKTEWTNIVAACLDCNQRKGNRTPQEAGMKLLSKPVRPEKLPDTVSLTLTWNKGDPDIWKDFMRSVAYWHQELEA
jgi:5-methylcytosine-specific restriction endonuclease McrA